MNQYQSNPQSVKRVVIAGGGTAGWMTAACLSKLIGKNIDVTLVESDNIATVGVGEATIPPIRTLHKLLGINEQEFIRETNATFKLGIEFSNWRENEHSYIHSFGMTGKECWAGEFHHFWLRGLEKGITHDFGDYCFELQAAKQNKFGISNQQAINFAYHLDATAYAKYLRKFSEALGAKRVEGKIKYVQKHPQNGFISALALESGAIIEGDLFIDCTGFRGLLIEQALHTGYDDWSHWLPCNTAVTVQTQNTKQPIPYTKSIAHEAGWQWRIPLQHRMGNGLVFCNSFMDIDQATEKLRTSVTGKMINEPRQINFLTGRRRKGWNKNCVAIGLSSGFIEPLESTSIHLIMTAAVRLMRLFPYSGITQSTVDEYNNKLDSELNSIRDFIVMHYKVTNRQDTEFWRHCNAMEIPDTLRHKLDLFKETGRVFLDDGDIFRVDSWTQVLMGQGMYPQQYHHIAAEMDDNELVRFLNAIRTQVMQSVAQLPSHADFVNRYANAIDKAS
ncbi:tryptophan halogenase family protein [Glaciecola sp. KUL10]|uniref:tryptophan halogenase family protein n=1 Tax=Glaciecola sp. (strain KUL10) TaxID=2161813 RepID=UPI000D78B800|nr:tryptophan halogenase family protein [Glaciecola sp. KUL10]GBL05926.1 tryptophan halogenase [Glaciecola sp. KUL10]